MTKLQKTGLIALAALIAFNIFAAGAIFGAFQWNSYKTRQAVKQDQVVKAAVKSAQVAEAPKN